MRFRVFTCESHQDLGIFAYVQPLYSHLCLLSHTCEYLLSYENRCWCDHKYLNISESVKFFKVLISVPKLDRKAWIFPTFFFVKILKFSKKSHICEAQEPHMWLYSHMWVRTVSLTEKNGIDEKRIERKDPRVIAVMFQMIGNNVGRRHEANY